MTLADSRSQFDPNDGVPVYVKVAMSLRAGIARGDWKIGELLPPFEDLAQRYGVALNTIRKAIQMIASDALVSSGRGRGTRVIANGPARTRNDVQTAINDPLSVSPDLVIGILKSEQVAALPPELQDEYAPSASYQRVHKTHTIRGAPFALLDVYVAHDLYSQLPAGCEKFDRLTRLLRDHCDIKIAKSRQELTISHADQFSAQLLSYPVAGPLVRLRRWRISSAGILVFACTILYRADMFVWDVVEEAEADHFVGNNVFPAVRPA
jgi:GntR family transcriptional regulator